MIKRINLIEKKVFEFTYQMLLQVCVLVIVLNIAMVGYQIYNTGNLETVLKTEKTELRILERKRDELTKKPVKRKVSVGQYQDLFDRIEGSPSWSELLEELSEKLPNTVWITSFKTKASSQSVAKAIDPKKPSKSFRDKNKKNKKGKAPAPEMITVKKFNLELKGLGSEIRNVTEFATGLSESKYFKNLILSESIKQAFGISFKIKSEIVTDNE